MTQNISCFKIASLFKNDSLETIFHGFGRRSETTKFLFHDILPKMKEKLKSINSLYFNVTLISKLFAFF